MLSAKARATGVFTGDEPAAKSAVGVAHGEVDFSLVLGGPLFQVLRRAHLTDDTLTLLRKRLFVIAMVVWLPLFVLSIVQGKAFKGDVALPFVRDLEVHIRFLVALPDDSQ